MPSKTNSMQEWQNMVKANPPTSTGDITKPHRSAGMAGTPLKQPSAILAEQGNLQELIKTDPNIVAANMGLTQVQ
eukprot:11735141-Karenia_brevis.AAC.1